MAEPEVRINQTAQGPTDLEMQDGNEIEAPQNGADDDAQDEDLEKEETPTRTTFLE